MNFGRRLVHMWFGIFSSGITGFLSLLVNLDIVIRSKRWPNVKGTIQTSQVKIEDKGIDDNGGQILLYRPEILYRYQIENKEFVVREPVYDAVVDLQSAEKWVAKYPTGTQVSVFYNPIKPRESTLKTRYNRIQTSDYLKIIIPLAVGALCFGLAFNA